MLNKTVPVSTTTILSYFRAYPHLIIQDPADGKIKYANTQYGSSTVYYPMNSITPYEWNNIILANHLDTTLGKWVIQVYVNGKYKTPDVNEAISSTVYDMKLLGIAFCQQNFPTCVIDRVARYPQWGSAWYRHLRIWDYNAASIFTIHNFDKLYTNKIRSILYYYKFTIDNIKANKIVDQLNSPTNDMISAYQFNNNFDSDIRLNMASYFDTVSSLNKTYVSGFTNSTYNVTLTLVNQPSSYSETLIDTRSNIKNIYYLLFIY